MAYNLEEQERIDALKAFWNRYGNFILTTITIVLLVIAGYRAWGWWQQRQAMEAAVVYEQLREAVEARDVAKVKEHAGTIFERYPRTAYAQMAALLSARVHHEANDLRSAKAPLQWAIERAQDVEFRQLARLRLAGILIDEQSYDEALRVLGGDEPGRFAPLYANRRGDALLALNRADEARDAYKQSLAQLGAGDPLRTAVQLKLDSLGGA
ncbi:MAG TPA: tetratricopeptide repeat protein [Burkholderiaceae bacterium]|nr:tetratricopeptide repeat protein [Burkholderiaceae bacterium]